VKRIRTVALLISLGLGLGGGLFLLDSSRTGNNVQRQVVGSLGPGSQEALPVGPGSGSGGPTGWIPVGGNPDNPARVLVTDKQTDRQTLEFELPGFSRENIVVGDRPCARISVPGLLKIRQAGLPELPTVTASLVVPTGGRTSFKILEHVVRRIKTNPVEPSAGHLTRNIDPATVVPEFSSFYQKGGIWPEEAVELGKPFTLRDLQGVTVRFNPLRYDADRGELVISEKLVVAVTTEGGFEKTLALSAGDDPAGAGFNRVYDRLFSNYTAPLAVDKYQSLRTAGRMLIITHPAFVSSLQGFMTWKRQRGIDVTLATVAELGGSATGIAQAIRTMYEEPGGLTWVILVGDKEQLPTNAGLFDGSDSDSRFAMVAGNDIYPDLFISRISATSAVQVLTQVNRFIAYERNPDSSGGNGWYRHGAGIASDEGTPEDFRRADLLRQDLLHYGFGPVEQIYQGHGGDTGRIRSALNNGCSLVYYLGHGSGYGWSSVAFSCADVRDLDNYGRWPWIIDVSCSNGNFSLGECFAESWLRAGTPQQPTGAVAVIAASSLSPWVPPTVMQAEAIDLLVADKANTIGSLYYSGLMRVLDTYSGRDVAMQVMEQNVIFGDCSLMVRTRPPREFELAEPPELVNGAEALTLDVRGPAGSVVAVTSPGTLHGTGIVDADGRAVVDLETPVADRGDLILTITGYNMTPYVGTLNPVDGSSKPVPDEEPEPEPELPARVILRGNYPNPFNPGTNIVFELPRDMHVKLAVYDIRGSLVRLLADESLPAGQREIYWDGRGTDGRVASSGVYLYRLVTPEVALSGRMTLTK